MYSYALFAYQWRWWADFVRDKKQSSYLLPRFLQPEDLGGINARQLPYPDIVKGYGEFKWISSLKEGLRSYFDAVIITCWPKSRF